MMVLLSWMPLVIVLIAVGVLLGALVSVVLMRGLGASLGRLAPHVRFFVLQSIAWLPALTALLLVVVCFGSSTLDALGLISDHCSHHADHAFHLCFVHGAPLNFVWPSAIGVVMLGLLTWAARKEVFAARRMGQWAKQLMAVGRFDEATGVWLLDAPGVAVTLGFLRPTVFVSDPEHGGLSEPQFRAVIAHEREHVQRRDALHKSVSRVLSCLHLPAVRQALLGHLDQAAEEACDQAASRAIGDRFTVAEAIVAASKQGLRSIPAPALGFGCDTVELRVQRLLDDDYVVRSRALVAVFLTGAILALVTMHEWLHHTLESVLSYLI